MGSKAFPHWLALALVLAGCGVAPGAGPYVPEHDDALLERLPRASRDEERALRGLRLELERRPDDLALALRLAWAYVDLGRRSGDPRHHGWAAGAARRWLALESPPSEVLLLRATLRQHHHAFDAALRDLARVLSRDPRDARAWLMRATILQVRGEVAAARQGCVPVLRFAEPLAGAVCLARAGAVSGRAAASLRLLRRALDQAPGASPELHAFARVSAAEIAAALARDAEAERDFEAVLSLGPPGAYLRAAHADFLLERGRAAEALALLPDAPHSESLLLRRVLAEVALGAPSAEARARTLEARFRGARQRGGALHLGEEARFLLEVRGRARQALDLAQRNFATQREPRDLRILLEAALAAGDAAAARSGLDFLRETGLEDRSLRRLARRLAADVGPAETPTQVGVSEPS